MPSKIYSVWFKSFKRSVTASLLIFFFLGSESLYLVLHNRIILIYERRS
ncbi:hypothetical protein FF38_13911 [Lucilia cuprina]|uniref:Uncharacterized protein n=1 Tax=Lucilia cuprina TaxID=7375 RepID=A0A0L0BML7_LUCCU|nr:hypothetical protein FF38_13911 [Lucilia cuprina]